MIPVLKRFDDIPPTIADVKQKLTQLYNGKCAYCESRASLEVEHYRPKGGVSKVKGHKGYYWLKYEWSNLLYSCHDCNNAKRTAFPLAKGGIRVFSPQKDRNEWLANSRSFRAEKPLILNPEIDDPARHLEFCCDGTAAAKNGSERGQQTINICKLNRQNLVENGRKAQIDKLFRMIKKQIFYLIDEETVEIDKKRCRLAFKAIFEEIRDNRGPECEFSMVYFFMYANFETFLDRNAETKNLPVPLKRTVKGAFVSFREGRL